MSPKRLEEFERLNLTQAIFDHSIFCIYVKDTDLRYRLINKHALRLFKADEAQVIGKTDHELFAEEFVRATYTSDQKVLETKKSFEHEEIWPLPQGNRIFDVVKTPLKNSAGEVYGICSIAHDITMQKKIEGALNEHFEKLENLTVEVMEARIVAEQAIQAKTAFLANMSHEIRTPINAVIGNLDLIKHTELSAKQETYLNRTITAANLLLEIIGQVLDFSKIAAGELKIESKACHLSTIAEECYLVMLAKAEEKGLRLSFNDCKETLPSVLSDPTRLKQIIMNLLGNAIKFTEFGFVSLSLFLLNKSQEGVTVQFVIEDSGIGIEKDKLSHIFEKFWQADVSISRKFGGTGLGLSITKELVELMGGVIKVDSIFGKGTTFLVEIPFKTLPNLKK